MDIKKQLVTSLPKAKCKALAEHVLRYPNEYVGLLDIIESGTDVQAMKGSWVAAQIRLLDPRLSERYQKRILHLAVVTNIGGVRRELLRCLESIRLEEPVFNELLECTLNWITDTDQDFAVRYLSQRIIASCSAYIPELKQELQLIKQLQLEKTGRFP
jgi:hypothetical protein